MDLFSAEGMVGEAHSKLILSGEHSVVYGKPAIALPFPLRIRAEVNRSCGDATFESLIYTGTVKDMPKELKGIKECIKEAFKIMDRPLKDVCISVISDIPLGRGLGSSAAAATAVVRGVFSFYREKLSKEVLFSLVGLSETHAHGKPSGIDMTAVVEDSLIYFKKDKSAELFKPKKPLYIVVADSGIIGDTRKAVEMVREAYQSKNSEIGMIIDRIGEIVHRARLSIQEGEVEVLGSLLNENHEGLRALGVSNEKLDNLINEARSLGALGAKLTGGGLGGCMLALAASLEEAKEISKGLLDAGATNSWYFSTEKNDFFSSKEVKGGLINESYGKSKYKYSFD